MTAPDSHTDPSGDSVAERPGELTRRSTVGAAWTMGALLITEPMRLVSTAVLARLLTPSDFGLVGMAAVFVGLGTLANDFGFTVALIKEKELSRRQVTGVFWSNIVVGALFTVLAWAAAPLLAVFYGEPLVAPLFRVFALTFAIASLFLVQNALLRRRMDFKTPAIASGVSVAVSGVVAIAAAFNGSGVWSLVWGNLAGVIASGIVVQYVSRLKPGIRFSWRDVRPFLGFGATLTGGELANYGVANVDNLIVGRTLGATSLGIYGIAYNLITYPVRKIAKLIAGVALPAFAKIQDEPSRFEAAYARALMMTSYTLVPLLAVAVVIGDQLIAGLYGDQWLGAIAPFRILCVAAVFAGLGYFSELVLKSLGDAAGYLKWALVSLVGFGLGAFVGSQWGVVGVATGVAVASVFSGAYGHAVVRATAGISWSTLGRSVAAPVLAASIAAAVAVTVRQGVDALLPGVELLRAGVTGGTALGITWAALRRVSVFSGMLQLEGLVKGIRGGK